MTRPLIKVAIVVPTIREHSIKKFIEEWGIEDLSENTALIVVEDNSTKTFKLPDNVYHFSHEDIDKEFPNPEIIPRKTSSVRMFGFWKAKQMGFQFILTLDDDCYPNDMYQELESLIFHTLKSFTSFHNDNKWFYTIDGMSRGMPQQPIKQLTGVSVLGWTRIPDIDGKYQMQLEDNKVPLDMYPKITSPSIVPNRVLYTMCGMGVAFKVDMAKYMFWFPTLNTYFRWDDIWMGFVVKRILDDIGLNIANNYASIKHSRASNAKRNFELEGTNNGYAVNDAFGQYIYQSYRTTENIDTIEKLCKLISNFDNSDMNPNKGKNTYFTTTAQHYLEYYKIMSDD